MSVYKLGMNISKKDLRDLIHRGQMASGIPLDRLEAICQAERDGRCVVLPCKVGDTVWINFTPKWPANPEHKGKWFTKEAEIERIKLGVKGLSLQTYIKSFTPDDFGKTVFLSYEAAQSALEGGAK